MCFSGTQVLNEVLIKKKQKQKSINKEMAIIFHSRSSNEKEAMLSNFYFAPFLIDGESFTSVEDYFHWCKYRDPFFVNRALDTSIPHKAHGLAALKKSKELTKEGRPWLIEGWHSRNVFGDGEALVCMRKGMYAKFTQNESFRRILLATGSKELLHQSRFMYNSILDKRTLKQGKTYGNFYWGIMKPASNKSPHDAIIDSYTKAGAYEVGDYVWKALNEQGYISDQGYIGMNTTGKALMNIRSSLSI